MHRIDRTGQIADLAGCKIHQTSMTFLCDTTQTRDFAFLLTARASKILGPISGHLVAQVIPMIRNVAQASRPGLALCDGMCAAKRFHADNEEHTCRVGCIDEPDCLSHHNRCLFFAHNCSQSGETPGPTFEETISSTTLSHKLYSKAFNMGFW